MESKFPTPSHCLQDYVSTGRLEFILLGAFALRDPVRPMVKSAVGYTRNKGHMNIRMVSGDHIETATATARKAGIISSED